MTDCESLFYVVIIIIGQTERARGRGASSQVHPLGIGYYVGERTGERESRLASVVRPLIRRGHFPGRANHNKRSSFGSGKDNKTHFTFFCCASSRGKHSDRERLRIGLEQKCTRSGDEMTERGKGQMHLRRYLALLSDRSLGAESAALKFVKDLRKWKRSR